jgi:hypothetical protein
MTMRLFLEEIMRRVPLRYARAFGRAEGMLFSFTRPKGQPYQLLAVLARLVHIAFQRRCRRRACAGCGPERPLFHRRQTTLDTRRRAGCLRVFRAAATRYGGPQGRPRGGDARRSIQPISTQRSAKPSAKKSHVFWGCVCQDVLFRN